MKSLLKVPKVNLTIKTLVSPNSSGTHTDKWPVLFKMIIQRRQRWNPGLHEKRQSRLEG
jgi:hypothetical protein